MTHLFGFILEELEGRAVDYAGPPCEAAMADPDAWFQQAKEELRAAWTRGSGIPEATERFLAARSAVSILLESIWPGREEAYSSWQQPAWAIAGQQDRAA